MTRKPLSCPSLAGPAAYLRANRVTLFKLVLPGQGLDFPDVVHGDVVGQLGEQRRHVHEDGFLIRQLHGHIWQDKNVWKKKSLLANFCKSRCKTERHCVYVQAISDGSRVTSVYACFFFYPQGRAASRCWAHLWQSWRRVQVSRPEKEPGSDPNGTREAWRRKEAETRWDKTRHNDLEKKRGGDQKGHKTREEEKRFKDIRRRKKKEKRDMRRKDETEKDEEKMKLERNGEKRKQQSAKGKKTR